MNQQEIEKLSINYANQVDDPENASWHLRYSSFKQGFIAGANFILESASESFEEWKDSQISKYPGELNWSNQKIKEAWIASQLLSMKLEQACAISKDREIKELKKDLKRVIDNLIPYSSYKPDWEMVKEIRKKHGMEGV